MLLELAIAWLLQAEDEKPKTDTLALVELPACRLPKDQVLVFGSRFDKSETEFIRDLRTVPRLQGTGTPTALIIEKHLKRPSRVVDTELTYLESDWMTLDELLSAAALVHRTDAVLQDLVGKGRVRKVKYVVVKNEKDYHALVDAWSTDEKEKKESRENLSSIFVGDYRCGYDDNVQDAYTTAIADTVCIRGPRSLRLQEALREGLHTYFSAFLTLDYMRYVSLDTTTPNQRQTGTIDELYRKARYFFEKSKRETVPTILYTELNSLNFEKLSVMMALVDYLVRKKRDRWPKFVEILDAESFEGEKPKGADGRRAALAKAFADGFAIAMEDLDGILKEFVLSHYLYEDQIAVLVGANLDCTNDGFSAFKKICKELREGNVVSDKGERIYAQIMERIRKRLNERKEKF